MKMLTEQELAQFEEQGYVIARGLLDVEKDIKPVIAEYEELLDSLCRELYAEELLPSTYSELPFGERLTHLYAEAGTGFSQHLDISLPQGGITSDTPIHLGPAVFHLLTSPRLLDQVEVLIGPEVVSNPVQHVRIKPPMRFVPAHSGALVSATSWHQDQGVVLPEADDTMILTVWLPVTSATVENGCLAVIPGSHRTGLTTHCPATQEKRDLHIPISLLNVDTAVPLPMEPGDVLFMHRRTQHSSLPNQSNDIRWSFDLRYNPIGTATGRPAFPEFIARSQANPERVLTDPDAWAALWYATRQHLAGVTTAPFNRWATADAVCA